MATREEKIKKNNDEQEKMSDEELKELSGGVTAQTDGVKLAKKPFFAVLSGKSDFEGKKLVLRSIFGSRFTFSRIWEFVSRRNAD